MATIQGGLVGLRIRALGVTHVLVESRLIPWEERADAMHPEVAALHVDAWLRDPWAYSDLYEIAERLNKAPPPTVARHAADAALRAVIVDALRYGALVAFEERETRQTEGGRTARSADGDEAFSASEVRREPPQAKTWIEVRLVDEAGQPVSGARFRLRLPSNEVRQGALDAAGRARLDGIDPGSCEICFPEFDEHEWS